MKLFALLFVAVFLLAAANGQELPQTPQPDNLEAILDSSLADINLYQDIKARFMNLYEAVLPMKW